MKERVRAIDANALHKEISEWPESVMYKDWVQSAIAFAPTLYELNSDPLTEEVLKEMIGEPVWIETSKRKEWCILWGYHGPEVCGRSFIFTRRTAQKEPYQFSELGVTWWAYRYPPTTVSMTCKGCVYEPDLPSHVRCQGCARVYTDHYTRRSTNNKGDV